MTSASPSPKKPTIVGPASRPPTSSRRYARSSASDSSRRFRSLMSSAKTETPVGGRVEPRLVGPAAVRAGAGELDGRRALLGDGALERLAERRAVQRGDDLPRRAFPDPAPRAAGQS